MYGGKDILEQKKKAEHIYRCVLHGRGPEKRKDLRGEKDEKRQKIEDT